MAFLGLGAPPVEPHRPAPPPVLGRGELEAPIAPSNQARLRRIIDAHLDFIWRSLRRLGVPATDVDDCAQQVCWVLARKLDSIEEGCERPFVFSTVLRVASDARRSRTRRREVFEEPAEVTDPAPTPEQVAQQRRDRALLDEVLDAMPLDLRTVFVLFELEELPTAEIAAALDLPSGTVASRLRRAREEFRSIAARLKAVRENRGGVR